jgi:hypothetical protein
VSNLYKFLPPFDGKKVTTCKMKILQHFVWGILVLCSVYGISSAKQTEKNSDNIAFADGQNRSMVISGNVEKVVFGIFCGECANNCAIMYSYHMGGNANMFWADYTDSYFKKGVDKMSFKTQVTDLEKYALASDIVKHIPKSLILSNKTTQKFGCPDCTDGCGIYFEITQYNENTYKRATKRFYIDYSTSELNGEIKEFVEYLKIAIGKLNDGKH